MSFINYMAREINCKIVYYGPGLCGKTTNLQYIYERTNPDAMGARFILLAYDAIHMVKFTDPFKESVVNGAGFVGKLATV